MKFGKKLWTIALLFCLALTLGLAGCGGNTDDPGKTDGPGTQGGNENPPATTYSVTLTKNFEDAMGTATLSAPASGDKYAKDELVTLTVTVNDGYVLESVTVGSEKVELEGGTYSFKVKEDATVTVSMRALAYYTVTLNKVGDGGTVKIAPEANADGKYLENTAITLTATENYGYKASVKVNGAEVSLSDSAYVFRIEKDTTIDVTYAERGTYAVTANFDAAMCDVAYYGKLEDGSMGNIPLVSGNATEIYEGETVFTAIPKGGYKIVSVTVDGKDVTLDGNGFTANVDKAITIAVESAWDVKSLTSLAGEFDLADDVWYTFTLTERSVFDFSANNYVAYASFYKVETVAEPAHGEDGDKPVWTFNDDDRTIQAVHAFEAGTYVARFTSNTGDGVGSSKLVITQVELLSFELPAHFCGSWQSTDVVENDSDTDDHIWSMYVDTDCFVLKKKDSSGVYRIVDATVTTEQGEYFVTVDDTLYVFMPAYNLVGTLALYKQDAPIIFLPNPLPDIKPPKELVGTYEGMDEDDEAVADLTVTENGITWDGKPLTLLAEISLEGAGLGAASPAALYEGKLYMISAQPAGSTDPDDPEAPLTYAIMLIDPEAGTTIMFTPKAEQGGVTIDAKFHGTWTCKVATHALNGYTLEITADNIVVKDASGQTVETTVGTHTYRNVDYPSFTVNGVTYFLYSVAHGQLTVYPAAGSFTPNTFVKA